MNTSSINVYEPEGPHYSIHRTRPEAPSIDKRITSIGFGWWRFLYLEIMTIVKLFIGIKSDELADTFTDLYCSFMREVDAIDPSELDENIPTVANRCFEMLASLVEIEVRVREES